jgi:putative selenium metabolism protein SsnA
VNSLILKDALCGSLWPTPALQRCDVRIVDGTIAECGAPLLPGPGETVENLQGALLLPGFVCAHTHLYSSLSRGMPGPAAEPHNFTEILASIWWKLDKALDEESIRASALAGGLEAVRCGVTTMVDHHASPNAIPGSLSIIEGALETIGLRGVLCYETSDRDGPGRRDQGLRENEEFAGSRRNHAMVRGLVGAHASFTLSDDTLRELGAIVERLNTGIHIHAAEDLADADVTRARFGRGIVERLQDHGLLRSRSVFAHCIHLTEEEHAALRTARAWMIHNPRSNMNNAVGHAPLHRFGERAALGTDGFPPDMFEEVRSAWFRSREAAPRVGADVIIGMLSRGTMLASEVFGRPIGTLQPGAAADLVVMDYLAPTPLTAENLPFHLLFGMRSAMVRSVMINGTWVMRDRAFVRVREEEVLRTTPQAAARLWRKMHE